MSNCDCNGGKSPCTKRATGYCQREKWPRPEGSAMEDPFWIEFRRGFIQGSIISAPFLIAVIVWGLWP